MQAYRCEELLEATGELGVQLRLEQPVGGLMIEDTVAARAWRASGAPLSSEERERLATLVDGAAVLGAGRSEAEDVELAFRHLVDMGLRAISPAINDPTTGVQAIQHLSMLLTVLAPQAHGPQLLEAPQGRGRVVLPRPDFAAYHVLAQGELRRHGHEEQWVAAELAHQLQRILEVEPGRSVEVRGALDRLREACAESEWLAPPRRVFTSACAEVERCLGSSKRAA